MINIKHGLLLVWGDEWIVLLDDVLRILTAWSGFDTVEYDSSTTGNLFMVVRVRHIPCLEKILNHRQAYNKRPLNPWIPGYPGIESP